MASRRTAYGSACASAWLRPGIVGHLASESWGRCSRGRRKLRREFPLCGSCQVKLLTVEVVPPAAHDPTFGLLHCGFCEWKSTPGASAWRARERGRKARGWLEARDYCSDGKQMVVTKLFASVMIQSFPRGFLER